LTHRKHHEKGKIDNVEERYPSIPEQLENITKADELEVIQEKLDIIKLLFAVVNCVK
jgi:hypothetical protein